MECNKCIVLQAVGPENIRGWGSVQSCKQVKVTISFQDEALQLSVMKNGPYNLLFFEQENDSMVN